MNALHFYIYLTGWLLIVATIPLALLIHWGFAFLALPGIEILRRALL